VVQELLSQRKSQRASSLNAFPPVRFLNTTVKPAADISKKEDKIPEASRTEAKPVPNPPRKKNSRARDILNQSVQPAAVVAEKPKEDIQPAPAKERARLRSKCRLWSEPSRQH